MKATSKTACRNCKHHICTHDGYAGGPDKGTWFYHRCMANLKPQAFDALTGETPEPEPGYCRDYNDGDCAKHEE